MPSIGMYPGPGWRSRRKNFRAVLLRLKYTLGNFHSRPYMHVMHVFTMSSVTSCSTSSSHCRTLVLEVSYRTQTQWLRPLNGSYAPSTGAPSFDTNFGAAADLPFSYICCKCSMICWTSALVRCLVRRSDGLNLFLIFTSVSDFSWT